MEQPRDRTRRVGSNKRQIYSSESRGWGRKASTSKQGSKQAGSETLPIVVGRGCIDQDEAGRRSLLRLYFRCCPCSCLLALSRKPSFLRPRSLSWRPYFFRFPLQKPSSFRSHDANHHHRRHTRRAANLPSRDSRKPPRRVHSFSDLSPRRLARSWIIGFSRFFCFYRFIFSIASF